VEWKHSYVCRRILEGKKRIMIRRANINDLEALAKINTNAWKINYKGIIDEDFLQKRTVEGFIEKRMENNWLENKEIDTFVYDENNLIKGFVSGNDKHKKYDSEIEALYVDTEYQKSGIGSQLLEYMKRNYKNKGCKKMIIWTIEGLQNNSFYKKYGGKIMEEKEYEYGNKKYPGIGFVFEL
jgi:N-acetylglutamate synthase-like GNAT family acetyltransferase